MNPENMKRIGQEMGQKLSIEFSHPKFLIAPTLLTTGNCYRPLKKTAISNLPMQTIVTSMPHNSETAGASKLQYLPDVLLQGGFLQHQGLGAVGKTKGNI